MYCGHKNASEAARAPSTCQDLIAAIHPAEITILAGFALPLFRIW
jgi:hypothetical protein